MAAFDITADELLYSIPIFAAIATGTYLILNRWFSRSTWWLALLFLALFYVGIIAMTYGLLHFLAHKGHPTAQIMAPSSWTDRHFIPNMLAVIGRYSMFGMLGFVSRLMITHARAKKAETRARLTYEYSMLTGQVSPHFMANLFYSWTSELKQEHSSLLQKIHQAYDLMIYYMDALQSGRRRIPLAREIEQLHHYIALSGKKDKPAHIQLEVQGDLRGYALPPVTLLTMLENAVKHGRTDLPDHPIRMQVTMEGRVLRVVCINRVNSSADIRSHGSGLANLRRRLELEFKSGFLLTTEDLGDDFCAELTIEFT